MYQITMTPEEYIESKSDLASSLKNTDVFVVLEEDAYEAVDEAKREIAWEVHKLICETHNFAIIDKYVTDICNF